MCRGVRGATTVERDTAEDILEATRELLTEIIRRNEIDDLFRGCSGEIPRSPAAPRRRAD